MRLHLLEIASFYDNVVKISWWSKSLHFCKQSRQSWSPLAVCFDIHPHTHTTFSYYNKTLCLLHWENYNYGNSLQTSWRRRRYRWGSSASDEYFRRCMQIMVDFNYCILTSAENITLARFRSLKNIVLSQRHYLSKGRNKYNKSAILDLILTQCQFKGYGTHGPHWLMTS